jgi:hypothetical protein
MIELKDDKLIFSFPEVHPDARLTITFKRTLRIPDDGTDYPLPPGLGDFPLRHVDDYAAKVPEKWLTRGGVMLPMYQSEAMWIRFSSRCFVHLANSAHWRKITGRIPPTRLTTASEYSQAGLPWFECYQEDPRIKAKAGKRKRRSVWKKFTIIRRLAMLIN